MPALNFQQRFAAAVESGEKRQTIRAVRALPLKVGDTLHLFTGMRTRACRRLGTVVCTEVTPFEIVSAGGWSIYWVLDDQCMTNDECDALAKADGFASEYEMTEWFDRTHGLPFEGVLIRWEMQDERGE